MRPRGGRCTHANVRVDVLARDNHRCRWCGLPATAVTRIVGHRDPRARSHNAAWCEQCDPKGYPFDRPPFPPLEETHGEQGP